MAQLAGWRGQGDGFSKEKSKGNVFFKMIYNIVLVNGQSQRAEVMHLG